MLGTLTVMLIDTIVSSSLHSGLNESVEPAVNIHPGLQTTMQFGTVTCLNFKKVAWLF